MTVQRQISEHAMAAAAIRKELKANFPGVKFGVTSQSSSMSTAVHVYKPRDLDATKVHAIVDKYQYGHFDGMTDCYEYSNKNKNLPQAKFILVQSEY